MENSKSLQIIETMNFVNVFTDDAFLNVQKKPAISRVYRESDVFHQLSQLEGNTFSVGHTLSRAKQIHQWSPEHFHALLPF